MHRQDRLEAYKLQDLQLPELQEQEVVVRVEVSTNELTVYRKNYKILLPEDLYIRIQGIERI